MTHYNTVAKCVQGVLKGSYTIFIYLSFKEHLELAV